MAQKLKWIFLSIFLLFSTSVLAGTSVDYNDANCVGAWLMDVDEDPLTDDSGQGNTGALLGAGEPNFATASPPPGGFSTGYYIWDGSNDRVICGNPADFQFGASDSFSLVGWFKTSTTGAMQQIIRYDDDAMYPRTWYLFRVESGGNKVEFELGDNNSNVVDALSASAYADGSWHHAVAVRDVGNDDLKLYVAGTLEADSPTDTTDSSFLADNWNLYIGANPELDQEVMNGSIDETAVFSRVLTSTEVNDIMDNGLAPVGVAAAGQPIFVN